MNCCAGIYPGVSNVMAAHMISIARREYTADWTYASSNGASSSSNGKQSQAASSGSAASTSSSAASEASQPEPLRSGVTTLEPNEGELLPARELSEPIKIYLSGLSHTLANNGKQRQAASSGSASSTTALQHQPLRNLSLSDLELLLWTPMQVHQARPQ